MQENLTVCSRCIYDSRISSIRFDENGVCNYCKMSDSLKSDYKTGTAEGERSFLKIVENIRRRGKNKKYDCIVGVSGGTDSSFMLHYVKRDLGLRPLAVHYDNTWNSAIATENIRKITKKLNVDLYTLVVDNKESDDIFRSFFLAGVPEIDAPTDLGFAETLNRAANEYNVDYVLEGHSFMEEGVSPLSTMYFDGKYIKDIHGKFGKLPMKTYPLMDFKNFMKWALVKRIRKIRPFWYIKYSKSEAMDFLKKEYGWKYYGGHHLENRMSAFMHSYYLPNKFNIDNRCNALSALCRNGYISRSDAFDRYGRPPEIESDLIEYVIKRFGLTRTEFDGIMNAPPVFYSEYKTYKRLFENLRCFFWVMYRMNLVPKSFYIKYTSKKEI